MKIHETFSNIAGLDIAVVGMAGQFPGAKNIDEFWQNLQDGVESISFFSESDLVSSNIDPDLLNNPNYVKAASILENVEEFDASFFGFEPKEAEVIDPQYRLFLECAWEAIENAGYDPETYKGLIGVYAGANMNTYLLENLYPNRDTINPIDGALQPLHGSGQAFLTTSVSYKLNLKGPSITLQTFCSTSLVAVHLACQSLLNEECDMALAGGVSIKVPQKAGYLYQQGGMLSPDGHCRAFDAKAQGTVFGSGAGIVVLKRLEDALADGDCIHAVIKGSAVNNDGSLKVNFTAPSVEGQAEVIVETLRNAGVDAEDITYIETHGTGTAMGDLIEIAALKKAFHTTTEKKGFCAIGSVKTNIGHLDAAAGVTSLIKTTLALKHKLLPPSLHFEQANPQIDFNNSPFYVNTQISEWKTDHTPRLTGVNSWGYGGTNAFVILEEAPPIKHSEASRPRQLLVISAKTISALEIATTNLIAYLKQHSNVNLANVAYTLQVGRRAFNHRRMVICHDINDAIATLEIQDPKRVFQVYQDRLDPPVVFMFPGQGVQSVNMALDLYQTEPTFQEQVDICSEFLQPHLGLDLRHILYPNTEKTQEAAQQLKQTAIAQPALFVIEYALAKLWMEWGIHPQAMIGESIGEYVAACLAGVLSLENALTLVAARGQLMQQVPEGAMLAIPLSEKEVQPLLGKTLSLAEIKESSLCIVSGFIDAVEVLQKQLASQGIECMRLDTSHALHSVMMDAILKLFTEEVKKVKLNPPKIPFVSNVTGAWITEAEATDPSYWVRHLRQTVRFAQSMQELLKQPERILLEVGPGQTLSAFARRHPDKEAQQIVLTSLGYPQGSQSDVEFLLNTLGQLWLAGVQVDWSGFYTHERRHRIPLPTYPFERQRYWIEPKIQVNTLKTGEKKLPATSLLGKKPDIADWFYVPSWKRSLLVAPQLSQKSVLSCTLVFIDECGLGFELVKRLELEGQDVITVKIGSAFTKLSDRAYILNPRQADDYDALLNELIAQNKRPKTIVHLWSIIPYSDAELRLEEVDKVQENGFYSLLFLAQALSKHHTDECQIAVVSNNMQEVVGEELLCPEKATLLGLVRVIEEEYSNIICRSIDVVIPQLGVKTEPKLLEQLLCELQTLSSEKVIAYRGNHRWVQTFEPIRLEKATQGISRLKEGGVYLITGGLEGIGLVLAQHLAQTVQAKLILTRGLAFPLPEEWEQWLVTHDEHDNTSLKIREIQKLKQLGAEVLVVSADVSNFEQMQQAIAFAQERFGQINGVIYAAEVSVSSVIPQKTPEMTESMLTSKIKGILILNKIFKDVPLDLFVLCSSITSIASRFGQVDNAAANAFIDAFACYKSDRNGTFTVSINWDSWQKEGMVAEAMKQSTPTLDISKYQLKEVSHPLFDQCIVEGKQQEIYISKFSVIKHWVLDEHRAIGKATLPGTAYLEMALAAFENHAQNGTIEIREVFFLTPLVIEDDEEKEVRTLLKKKGEGFEFSVTSQSNSGSKQWIEHAKGEIACIKVESSAKQEIRELEARCNQKEIIIPEGEHKLQTGFVEFGSRWNNLKQAKLGTDRGLIALELPEVFATDINSYKLHPALLDNATGFLSIENEGVYLPFSYKSLKIKKPLPSKVYSHIRYTENNQFREGILKFNITIMDDQGNELVEIAEFIMRKVDIGTITAEQSNGKPRKISSVSASENFSLEIASPGILDTLTLRPSTRQKPGLGEVEIEVCATGLNFKEVLIALGLLPVPPNVRVNFGRECSGKIVALGEGVKGFEVGDEVIAFGDSCFNQFTTTPASLVALKPDHLSLEEAATIPVAFITAYYALIKLARLRQGEGVLIHAAAGGVGMAAVQIAQWVGAKIFATAGNPEKRAFLHSLGIEYVMDSRSLAFADEVMKYTDGKGVDVVLNSLSGEFMTKSLSLLAPYGRFLELGKRDILNNSQLGLRPFEKCLSFFATEVGNDLPDFISTWHEVVQHFKDGNFNSLPHQIFPITEVAPAFEYMAKAKHIGKIVVSWQNQEALKALVASEGEVSQEKGTVASPTWLVSPSTVFSTVDSGIQDKPAILKEGLLPKESIEAFDRILGSTLTQVLVSTRDFLNRVEQDNGVNLQPFQEASQKYHLSKPTQSQPALSGAYVAPRNEIEQKLAVIWKELLGKDLVGIQDNFFEIGGNSLLIVQVRSQLQQVFNGDISTADLFEYPTISTLAEYLSRKQAEEPAFGQAYNRAKRQQEVMEEEMQLMKQRRKIRE
ncbi:MAG: beta-ketoacyl synthase N-terminal-like domain-containing protein [Nostoc sp.]|uniref:beta-ketoacyl synthase N-terminal-like domain-containing protein n=1 Tax=Nostoc sp. TaxID=1180 RepID=UPI002FEE99F4